MAALGASLALKRRMGVRAVGAVGPVVVGTDFSETAAIALQEARRLATLLSATLELVHVVQTDADTEWCDGDAAEWLVRAGIEPGSVRVRHGSAWVELARYAGEVQPSLLVIGSHGCSGYQPLMLGSTASRLTLHARCAVVVVSPRTTASDMEQYGGADTLGRGGAAAGAR